MEKSGSEKPGAPLKDISISVAQRTRSKKRKLSQISTSSAAPKNINLSSPPQATEDDAGDKSNDGQDSVEPNDDIILATQRHPNSSENPLNNEQGHGEPSFDDSILKSEIYQIYCQAEDSYQAVERIKEHNNCVFFERENQPFVTKEEFQRISESTLSNLWKLKPGETKFDRLKKFINGTIKHEVLGSFDIGTSMQQVFQSMTKIQILEAGSV